MHRYLQYGLLLFCFYSCTNRDSEPNIAAPYAEYTLTGDEESENIICVFRFYATNTRSEALLLQPPAAVLFDGNPVAADSAGLSGTYYEVQQPKAAFTGTHTIVFKDARGKAHSETFDFNPLALAAELPETVLKDSLRLPITGVANGDELRVLLTDTSFQSVDVNELLPVKNGAVVVGAGALQNLVAGPVVLQVFRETEQALRNAPGGGYFSATYSFSRVFRLAN